MRLKLFVGTEKMCMFHEPAEDVYVPVSRLAGPGPTNKEKVNCSFLENTLGAKMCAFSANHCQSLNKMIYFCPTSGSGLQANQQTVGITS
jgi:hypothetical protein